MENAGDLYTKQVTYKKYRLPIHKASDLSKSQVTLPRGQVTYYRSTNTTRNALIYRELSNVTEPKCTLFRLTRIYSGLFEISSDLSECIAYILDSLSYPHCGQAGVKNNNDSRYKFNLNTERRHDKFSLI